MSDPSITANIGSLDALPGGAFLDTDVLEVERVRPDPEPNDNYHVTWGDLKAAIAEAIGSGAQTGDTLVSARNPGAGWLELDRVYAQAGYPALYALVGLIGDRAPGRVWSVDSGAPSGATINDTAWLHDGVGVAVGANMIWRTVNGGVSWASIPVTGNLNAVVRVSDSGAVAVGASGVILRSTDAGLTWSSVSSGVSASLNAVVAFTGSRLMAFGASSTMLVSTDGGVTWTSPGSAGLTGTTTVLRFSSTTAVIIQTGLTGTRRTTDSGLTWVTGGSFPAGKTWTRTGAVFSETEAIIVGHDGTLNRTADAGVTWQTVTTLSGVGTSPRAIFNTGTDAAVVLGSGNSQFTPDRGLSWFAITQGMGTATAGIAFPPRALAIGNAAMFQSLPEYSFDAATQFKTPAIAGIRAGLKGYIKA